MFATVWPDLPQPPMLPRADEMSPISEARPATTCFAVPSRYIVRNMNSAFPADILHLQVSEHGADARVVTVTGEVDALTAPRLADVLTAQLAVARIVVVDLDAVQFMASAGLRVLFEIDELATRQDRCLRLVSNSPTVTLVLETSGLRDQFTVADNVPDALNNVL